MKLRLNPYGDNFMYIDKDAGVYMDTSSPFCTIDDAKVNKRILCSIKAETILVVKEEEIIPPVPPEEIIPPPEEIIPPPEEVTKKPVKKGSKK